MILTADTDYVADYQKPIKSRCFDQKSSKIAYLTLKNFWRPFLVIGPLNCNYPTPKIDFFYVMIGIGGADYSHRLQPIPLVIGPITSITDVSLLHSDYLEQDWNPYSPH